MVGNFEAVGDAITGGIVGRAVEPRAGEIADGYAGERNCLNCGAALAGPFCSQCGQHAHVHKTLTSFFHDFAHGVFHLEGKLWNTIPLLAWKPGELTRRYIDGQRARFVSPIALFLFCVFLMFSTIEMTGGSFNTNVKAQKDIASELQSDQQKVAALEQQRAAAVKAGKSTDALDEQITDLHSEVAGLLVANGAVRAQTVRMDGGKGVPHWLQRLAKKASEDPQLLLFKLKTNAYKFSWALIPISVPFVWLLFPFSRRFRVYDHTVFVTYSLCFMMLLLSVGTLIGTVSTSIGSICWFLPPAHMYRQLRGAYGVGAWGAIWRTFALTIFAFIAIGLFASLLFGLGAME